jgi:hypothetical protein
VLIENLIRLGRLYLNAGASPKELLELVSDVTSTRGRRFLERVFVVELAIRDGVLQVVAHPQGSWGHVESGRGGEFFCPDKERVIGIPFVMSRGNPLQPQGRYPVPVYTVFDKHFAAFCGAPVKVEEFLRGRIRRTVGLKWTESLVYEISSALHAELAHHEHGGDKKRSAVVVVADLRDGCSPYVYDRNSDTIDLCGSRIWPGRRICVDPEQLLDRVWVAKAAEGAEMGTRDGFCSVCRKEGEVASIYSKAWPWFSTTWTAPLPSALGVDQLVEGVALCHSCYTALTIGAQLFTKLSQPLGSWVTGEGFGITDRPFAKGRCQTQVERIYGSLMVLPVLDENPPDDDDQRMSVRSLASMRPHGPHAVERYLDSITGFEARIPDIKDGTHRLHLYYYSGDVTRGDVHVRCIMEDVMPSVARTLDRLLYRNAEMQATEAARQLGLSLSERDWRRLRSLPCLLATAYGSAHLWQTMSDVLQRRVLEIDHFVRNAASRMQACAHRLPKTYRYLRLEVLFYVVFRAFWHTYHSEIAESDMGGRMSMRSWQELQAMLAEPVQEIHFYDVEELGFVCGHLVRQFSRWYFARTGQDLLRQRILTFGSVLTPELVRERALTKFWEYRAKLWRQGILPQGFEQLTGVALWEWEHRRDEISRRREAFMAAFWAGYALQSSSGEGVDEKVAVDPNGEWRSEPIDQASEHGRDPICQEC